MLHGEGCVQLGPSELGLVTWKRFGGRVASTTEEDAPKALWETRLHLEKMAEDPWSYSRCGF